MPRIIGFDPGSRITGYGVIETHNGRLRYIASGNITANPNLPYLARLPTLTQGMHEVLKEHQPSVAALEQSFVAVNAATALKLGQVRGIAIALLVLQSIPFYEYSPREVKKMVTGTGNAAKVQVQYMVQKLLNLNQPPSEDAADALAVAISHIRNI